MQKEVASKHAKLSELIEAKSAELSAATGRSKGKVKVNPGALVTISSVISAASEDLEAIDNFQKIAKLLGVKEFCAIPVPGDGSCAIHALLALQSSEPFVESEMDSAWKKQAIQSVRDEVARLWREASSHPVWTAIYQAMSDTFDNFDVTEGFEEKSVKGEHVKKEVQAVATPNKKRRVFEGVVDLCTPPRASVKNELIHTPKSKKKKASEVLSVITPPAVEKVQGSRGAMRKSADPSTMSSATAKMSAALLPEPKAKTKMKKKAAKVAQKLIRKQQPAKKKKKQEVQPEEKGDDAIDAPPSPAHPRRVRRMQKRQPTMDDRKLIVVGHYLASMGLTWPISQQFHSAHPVDQKALLRKKNSGWVEMKKRLANRQPPECLTCLAQLKTHGFDEEKLDALLSECENETCATSPWTKLKRSLESLDVEAPMAQSELPVQCTDMVLAELAPGAPAPQPVSADVLEEVRKMRCLEILLPGTDGKSRPVVCRACTSKQQPQGRVFDLTDQAIKSDRKGPIGFLKQHCLSAGHLSNVKRWVKRHSNQSEAVSEEVEQEKTMLECQGLSLTHAREGRRAQFNAEVRLWASHTNLSSSLSQHSYTWNINKQELVLRHKDCLKVASSACQIAGARPVCANCWNADKSQNSLKNALRFSTKHWLARLLEARLFRSDEDIGKIEEDIKSTALYAHAAKRMDEYLVMSNEDLQSWVRKSFAKWPHYLLCDAMRAFLDRVVHPALTVSVSDCKSDLRTLTSAWSVQLVSGNLDDLSKLCA